MAKVISAKIKPTITNLKNETIDTKLKVELSLVDIYLDEIMTNLADDVSLLIESLSATEIRVAILISSGLTSAEIAEQLYVSLHTVKTHRRNIRKKLNIQNRQVNLCTYLKSRKITRPPKLAYHN